MRRPTFTPWLYGLASNSTPIEVGIAFRALCPDGVSFGCPPFTESPFTLSGMGLPRIHQFFDDTLVGLPGAAVWPPGKLLKAVVTIPLEAIDPLIGCLPGNEKTLCQFGYGVVVQLIVLEGSLSLFTHGNTFPRHGLHLLHETSVTHVFRIFCYLCPELIRNINLVDFLLTRYGVDEFTHHGDNRLFMSP
jgi:hypothetical protein